METFSVGLLRAFWLLFMPLVLVSVPRTFADEATDLTQAYKGKVFIVRNFWHGDTLSYDSAGQLVGEGVAGRWTTDGIVRVEAIGAASGHLQIHCKKMVIAPTKQGLDFKEAKGHSARREIDVDLGQQSPTRDVIESIFAKVFVDDSKAFSDSVPEYWRQCINAAFGKRENKLIPCHFAPEFEQLFAATTPSGDALKALPAQTETLQHGEPGPNEVHKTGGAMTAPHVLSSPDPSYSEEGRQAHVQGSCVMSLIVDASGSARHIQIVRPLGYGLDENAVAAVANWRFDPGQKNGKPVPVYSIIEVDFHE